MIALSLWKGEIEVPDGLPKPRVTMREIAARVAEEHGLTVADLQGPSRSRHISWPRQQAMYETREQTSLSQPAIGAYFGGRDHTTVLHACRAYAKRLCPEMPD